MKRTTLVVLISIVLTNFALINANAGSLCNNGTMSSNSGRGTCSYNGGVNNNFPSYSDPGSSSYNRNNGFGSSNNGFGSSNNGFGSSRNNGYSNQIETNGLGAYRTGTQKRR